MNTQTGTNMKTQQKPDAKELGMLLGLHAGDSLGATLEFSQPSNRNKFLTEIIGGGAFHWLAGEPTDDTELALAVLKSIQDGYFNEAVLKKAMINWFNKKPKDIGNTTRSAIENMISQKSPSGTIGSASNGSLMRCAPLALLKQKGDKLKKLTKQQSILTHQLPLVSECDYLLINAIQLAISGKDKESIFKTTMTEASQFSEKINQALGKLKTTAWDDLKTDGYVISTLCSAFWGLLHSKSFEEGVTLIINRGDDADTCGAVTGALLGAYYGVESIPKRWLEKLQAHDQIISLYSSLKPAKN